jgi:hypothetical protein
MGMNDEYEARLNETIHEMVEEADAEAEVNERLGI